MYIDNTSLTREFYNTIMKKEYPHIPFTEVDRVCKSPFHFVRYHMNRARLSSIRIKQFGTFVLYPNKILRLLETNDYNLKCKAITRDTHEKAKQHLLDIYSEVISVRKTGLWGRGIEIVDTTEDPSPILPPNE